MTFDRFTILFLLCVVGQVCVSCKKDNIEPTTKPIDTTTVESPITVSTTPYSAIIEGVFYDDATEEDKVGIKFSLQNTKYITTSGTDSSAVYVGNGRHRVELRGLYTDTTYYFCTYRRVGNETKHESIMSFRTKSVSIETLPATDVYAYGAQFGLRLSEELDKSQFHGTYGLLYSTRPRAIREYSQTCDTTLFVHNLRSQTTYYYRAYVLIKTANLQDRYVYGECFELTTPDVGVETLPAENVGIYDADLVGQSNVYFDDFDDYGFLLFTRPREVTIDSVGSTTTDQTIVRLSADETDEKGRGRFVTHATGLSAKHSYFYRAFAVKTEVYSGRPTTSTYYGEIDTLSTNPLVIDESSTAVDLGLSVLWNSVNVGASLPQEIGDYYSFEERKDIPFGTGERLPTDEEVAELVEKCTWHWVTYKKTAGVAISSKNGNSIFVPANMLYIGKYTSGVYMQECDSLGTIGTDSTARTIYFGSDMYNEHEAFKSQNEAFVTTKIGVRAVKDR